MGRHDDRIFVLGLTVPLREPEKILIDRRAYKDSVVTFFTEPPSLWTFMESAWWKVCVHIDVYLCSVNSM